MTMPTIDIKDWNNKKVGSFELSEEIFGYPYKEHLIHEAVRNYLASLRQGTAKVKNRSEVSGSGKKPFRQKGTGRARQGGNRPPIHRHGGTVFGPTPRDYSYKMNAQEKKAALKSALSQRVKEGKLVLLSEKSTLMREAGANVIAFEVDPGANKIQVKDAVEELFKVKVDEVRLFNVRGKVKKMGRYSGKRRDWRKAYVRLKEGEKAPDFIEGV